MVDKETIRHVAKIARLDLTDAEIKEFLPQLQEILDAFSTLESVDTKGIGLSCHVLDIRNHLREDEPSRCLTNKEALANSGHSKDGYFMGPRVV